MFKTFIACSAAALAAFVFMGLQTGLFTMQSPESEGGDDESPAAAVVQKKAPRAKFPDDLAPAARAKPVAVAKEYTPGDRPHKMVCLKVNGAMHSWQEDVVGYSEEWAAGNVEETELVLVIGQQKRSMIQRVSFVNGPPIDRNQYEVEVAVVEAKTGTVLSNRTFINVPRPVQNMEEYATTAVGSPVKYIAVFNWLSNQAKAGFPNRTDTSPIVITNR